VIGGGDRSAAPPQGPATMNSGSGRAWRLAPALAAALLLLACKTTTTVDGATVPNDATPTGVPEGDVHKRAGVRLQLASNYYQKGQMQIALDEARQAVELDPGFSAAYGLLGLIEMDLGNVAEAESSFRRALALDRDNPDLNNNYGWFLCRTKRERESMAYFDRAAGNKLYGSPAMALQDAGICMLQVGDDQKAEQYLLRAFEADASSPVAKFQLAQLYLARHQLDRANFYFDLLTKGAEPTAESLWLGLRIAHARGDASAERRLRDELRSRFPNSPQAEAQQRGQYDN
jgi:type IV pilus assembly protein PilF